MLDFIYVASTIVFFALMLAFVHGLERLGRDEMPCGRAVMTIDSVIGILVSLALLLYLVYTLLPPERF